MSKKRTKQEIIDSILDKRELLSNEKSVQPTNNKTVKILPEYLECKSIKPHPTKPGYNPDFKVTLVGADGKPAGGSNQSREFKVFLLNATYPEKYDDGTPHPKAGQKMIEVDDYYEKQWIVPPVKWKKAK